MVKFLVWDQPCVGQHWNTACFKTAGTSSGLPPHGLRPPHSLPIAVVHCAALVQRIAHALHAACPADNPALASEMECCPRLNLKRKRILCISYWQRLPMAPTSPFPACFEALAQHSMCAIHSDLLTSCIATDLLSCVPLLAAAVVCTQLARGARWWRFCGRVCPRDRLLYVHGVRQPAPLYNRGVILAGARQSAPFPGARCMLLPLVCSLCAPCVCSLCVLLVYAPCVPLVCSLCVLPVCSFCVLIVCAPCVLIVCAPCVLLVCAPCVLLVCAPCVCSLCAPCVCSLRAFSMLLVCAPCVLFPCSLYASTLSALPTSSRCVGMDLCVPFVLLLHGLLHAEGPSE